MKEKKYSAEEFLQLEKELDIYRKMLTDASKVIRDKDVSDYPIFVAHQQKVEIGMVIYDKDQNAGSKWTINAATLEEFVSKQIIHPDKIEEFKNNYKDPDEFVCVFALSTLGAQFLFLPTKS